MASASASVPVDGAGSPDADADEDEDEDDTAPPTTIPPELCDAYSHGGTFPIYQYYFDATSSPLESYKVRQTHTRTIAAG